MFKAHILSPWTTDDGNHPALIDLLRPGDSITDVTAQPAENIAPDPNTATWELSCSDYATIDDVKADDTFFVIMEWEEVTDG